MNSGKNDERGKHEPENARQKDGAGFVSGVRENLGKELDGVDRAVRMGLGTGKDVAASVGGSIGETLKSIRTARDFVVMARLSKESLRKLDDLVECGLTKSRSEAAAFLIAEGIRARADLYDRIAEQSEVIRKAREQMRSLIDEEPDAAPGS